MQAVEKLTITLLVNILRLKLIFSGTELLIHWRQAFIYCCRLHQVWMNSWKTTPYMGKGQAHWACPEPNGVWKVMKRWKLVFNDSTVLFQRKSTSSNVTTEWEIYTKLWDWSEHWIAYCIRTYTSTRFHSSLR